MQMKHVGNELANLICGHAVAADETPLQHVFAKGPTLQHPATKSQQANRHI